MFDQNLIKAQASLAASAEYSVFNGKAPGPRQSLGSGPLPGPRPKVQVAAPLIKGFPVTKRGSECIVKSSKNTVILGRQLKAMPSDSNH